MAFFTHFTRITQATAGAQRISGTQGDMTTFLDDLLVTRTGWSILFTATNERIYQAPSGNRFPLYVNDNSAFTGDARITVVRACASASAISTFVDPFPTTAQVVDASCNWIKSSTAATTARNYYAYAFDWGFYLCINYNGVANNYPVSGYTDFVPRISGDLWATVVFTRNGLFAASTTGINGINTIASPGANSGASSLLYQCRNATGAIKSSRACFHGLGDSATSLLGIASDTPIILAGPGNSIDMIQTGITDLAATGASTGAIACINRGYMPNMRTPVHSALTGVDETGDFEQASHDPLARFRLFKVTSGGGIIIEETNTWLGTSTG